MVQRKTGIWRETSRSCRCAAVNAAYGTSSSKQSATPTHMRRTAVLEARVPVPVPVPVPVQAGIDHPRRRCMVGRTGASKRLVTVLATHVEPCVRTDPGDAVRAAEMLPGETVIHSGLVEKRVGFFSRKRQLFLTNKPRLLYFDPSKCVYKGEIPWGPTLKVVVKDAKVFDVCVVRGMVGRRNDHRRQCRVRADSSASRRVLQPGRDYHLKAVLGSSQAWREAIEACVRWVCCAGVMVALVDTLG